MNKFTLALVAASACLLSANAAQATTIDFGSFTSATNITTPISGVSITLAGGPATGAPMVSNSWSGWTYELYNTPTGNYPTAANLEFSFSTVVTDLSFYFKNYGYSPYGRGASTYTSYATNGSVISTGFISGIEGSLVNVTGSGIAKLVLSNNTGGTNSWQFAVPSISFTASGVAAVPEPATWALMILGFGVVAQAMRQAKAQARRGVAAA